MMPGPIPDDLLTPTEAGLQLRMHEKSVRTLCAGGKLRCIVTYGPKGIPRYRIPQSAIDEWRRVHEQRRTA